MNEFQLTPDKFIPKLNSCPKDSFSAIHFNCRSLNRNHLEIENLLCSLNYTFDVIALTETWIKNELTPNIIFNDYKYVGLGRSEKQGGGIGLGIKDNIEYVIRDDLNMFNDICESCFVEIPKPGKNLIIGVFYRPPEKSVYQFNHILRETIEKINVEHKDCIFMGDYNIDINKVDQFHYVNDFFRHYNVIFFSPTYYSSY